MEDKFRVEIVQILTDPTLNNTLWELYKTTFIGLEKLCAQNQCCYTESVFRDALNDKDIWKFILYYKTPTETKPVALMLATNNLEKARVAYINPEKLKAEFPQAAIENKIYYFTYLGILSEFQQSQAFSRLCSQGMVFIFNTLGGIAAFDFSHESRAKDLPKMFQRLSEKMVRDKLMPYPIKYICIGKQEFGVLVPDNLKDVNKKVGMEAEFKKGGYWGLSSHIDLHNCNPQFIRSKDKIAEFIDSLCAFIKVKKFGQPTIERFGSNNKVLGYSAMQLIESSSITCHFVEADNSVYLDVFSCAYFNPDEVAKFSKDFWGATELRFSYIFRK